MVAGVTRRERTIIPAGIANARMAPRRRIRAPGSGVQQVVAGFGLVLLAGTLLLMLPVSAQSGGWVAPDVAAFTAVSAICVTGLVVVDTQAHWSGFGEGVILTLIQVGGLGYMLGTTVVLWAFGRRLGIRDQHMLRLYYGAPSMQETLTFARRVALFAFAFEATGALILWAVFAGRGMDAAEAAWWGVFHAVSAFNNAGFSVTGADAAPFLGHALILPVLALLTVVGGIGYIPMAALARRRSFHRLPLDSKLIFLTSGVLLLAGTLFVLAEEWRNEETLGALAGPDRFLAAFFHSVNARTAGMSALPVGAFEDETKVVTIGLMFVGGAAGSTAGGVKVGVFSLLLAVMIATLQGRDEVAMFRRQVPQAVIRQATTLALTFVGMVFVFTLALTLTAGAPFIDVIFEAMSALGTVGFSAAGTHTFDGWGRAVLMAAMLAGRFGPLLLVLYMARPHRAVPYHHPVDSVRLG